MAETPSRKKTTKKAAPKKAAKKKAAPKREKAITSYMSDERKEQLSQLGDKLSEATEKGVHVAKDVAERVRQFASDATELTKLKLEIHRLKNAQDQLFYDMGKKLWALYESKTLPEAQTIFTDDFQEMERLRAAISNKEAGAKDIHL